MVCETLKQATVIRGLLDDDPTLAEAASMHIPAQLGELFSTNLLLAEDILQRHRVTLGR